MSAILINSESKLSHCINNNNLESDNLSDEGLFNSLFMIISQKSEDIRLSKKVSDIKNLLYNNIYNNLTEINKTKIIKLSIVLTRYLNQMH